MSGPVNRRSFTAPVLAAAVVVVCATAAVDAHVALDQPNGGETLDSGVTAVIEWHIVIGHATMDWDLWYSVTGPAGPWLVIAADLPPGDITTGAVHTYQWVVPVADSDQVRVRVRQDNVGPDYEDISDGDLVIRPGLFEDGFESGDVGAWSLVVP